MKAAGWYLGLRYMRGAGLVARAAEPLEAARRGAQFLFADRVLCEARNWQFITEDWWDGLAVGGHLILWLPDCRYCDLEPGEAKLTLDDVSAALARRRNWQLCEADLIDGHAYVVFRKHAESIRVIAPWRKRPRHVLVARTGAHGDALMASSILPHLKRRGWAVDFISREAGCEVLQADPHIDELILLGAGQAKEDELPYYWQAWAKRYDRFINLAGSVEGDLLKQPTRGDYFWSDEQRRKLCGRSYLGYLHKLAGVPKPYRVRFYPAEDEIKWAARMALNCSGKAPGFILWALRGSAVHKWWPYTPEAVCQLLARTRLNIVLTGNAEAAPLAREVLRAAARYYGDSGRIVTLTGTHSIRQIMTLAHHARLVIGPETGVLNAVSREAVPKIVLLSHSAAANLSDDWAATTALEPAAPCYPCHRLHYDHQWCPQDAKTGAAACAASIPAARVVTAALQALAAKPAIPWWLRKEKHRAA
jgi:ADP-heptose:LPS heptosyltransferase